MKTKLLFLVVAFLYFLVACKKEIDNVAPTISVSSPANLQNINGFDTLQIMANINDNRNIESISVSLKDLNNIPVLSTIIKTPNLASYSLNVFYFFDDIHLASGKYYFDISASDGVNVTHKYIDIMYGEVAKIRKGIIFFTNNGNSTSVYRLSDFSYTSTLNNTISGDFIGGSVNSYDQQIITSGVTTGGLNSLSTSANTINWSVTSTSTIKGFFASNRDVFISKSNGEIISFDNKGMTKSYYQAYPNYYGEIGLVYNNVFVSEQHPVFGNDVRLVVYWMASAGIKQQLILAEDVVNLFPYTNNKLILFANDLATATSHIYIYDVTSNLKWAPFVTLNSGIIDDCLAISNGVYLVLQNGNISKVDVNALSNTNYMTVVGATKIKYDGLNNELVVVASNKIDIYNYTTKNLKGSYTHSSTILDVDFLYNK